MPARTLKAHRLSLPALGVVAVALIGVLGPTHARAATPPTCSFLFWDDSTDAPQTVTGGGFVPNLDIIEGDFGLSADHSTLRAVLTLNNQDFSFETGANSSNEIDYQIFFTFNNQAGPEWATDASLTLNPSGPPTQTFTFGTVAVANNPSGGGVLFTQFAATNVVTGSFGSGPLATVEVDVPLSDIDPTGTPPTIGSQLTNTAGFAAEGVGGPPSQGNLFIADQDPSGGFGHNYTLGQTTCIDSGTVVTPEAPLTIGLVLVGGVAAATIWRLRRRRGGTLTAA